MARSFTLRFALAGAAFGFGFPIVSTLLDWWLSGLPFSAAALVQVQLNSPLHWIIDSAPVVLGIFAGVGGSFADRLQALGARQETIIAERTVELTRTVARAEALARTKAQFLANMSHEIRTPLNGILGMAQLLQGSGLDDEQRTQLDVILDSGKLLLSLLNDILNVSKLEAGHVDLHPEDFDLRRLVEEGCLLISGEAQRKGVDVQAVFPATMPANLVGDAFRLRQILGNLLGNAIKFTEQGEITVTVQLQARSDGYQLCLEVRDTGIGVGPAQQERLFDAFAQADATTTRRYGGTGLGLTICRNLCELMGGQIHLESEAGQGSRFLITAELAESKNNSPAPRWPDDWQGQKALLVSPATGVKAALSPFARGLGLCVATASPDLDVSQWPPSQLLFFDVCAHTPPSYIADCEYYCQQHRATGLLLLNLGAQVRLAADSPLHRLHKPLRAAAFLERLRTATKASLHPQAPCPAPASDPEDEALPSRTVLLVEDNPVNRLVARNLLRRAGYSVLEAINGQVALETVKATPLGEIDLILMDCHMPVMDGLEATRAIRALPGDRSKLCILALSASALEEDRERAREAGMDEYLTKPIELESLERALARFAPIQRAA